MKIGIDAEMFSYGNRTGIPYSVIAVLSHWRDAHPEHEYYLFSPKPIELFETYPNNWKVIVKRILPANRLWHMMELPILIRKYNIDAFWGTNYTLPCRLNNTKYVLTIYDLAWLLFDGIGEKKHTKRLKRYLPLYIKRADKMIAISEATREDLIRLYDVSAERVSVSYCGGSFKGKKETEDTDSDIIRPEVKRNRPFFLFVSTLEPRKNVITIIRAFEKYLSYKDGGEDLILAGGKGWNCDEIYSLAESSEYKDRIILTGYITEREKDYLMKNAIAFLYPSIYEGFGIPILEAFSYGLVVITTRVSSMPEVAGDAAFYIKEPYDYVGLAKKMREVVNLSEEDKAECINAMKKRGAEFSWEKYAEDILHELT